MENEFATQTYVDVQLEWNENSHNQLWEYIRQLQNEIADLKAAIWRLEDRLNTIERQDRW